MKNLLCYIKIIMKIYMYFYLLFTNILVIVKPFKGCENHKTNFSWNQAETKLN